MSQISKPALFAITIGEGEGFYSGQVSRSCGPCACPQEVSVAYMRGVVPDSAISCCQVDKQSTGLPGIKRVFDVRREQNSLVNG